jgi:transposase-like protein
MARSRRHPREVREPAVGMVLEHRWEYASQWEAIVSVAGKVGMSSESLRRRVRQAETDAGQRSGALRVHTSHHPRRPSSTPVTRRISYAGRHGASCHSRATRGGQ